MAAGAQAADGTEFLSAAGAGGTAGQSGGASPLPGDLGPETAVSGDGSEPDAMVDAPSPMASEETTEPAGDVMTPDDVAPDDVAPDDAADDVAPDDATDDAMAPDDAADDAMAPDDAADDDMMGSEMPGESDADVPDIDGCRDVADWDPVWAQFEDEVLLFSNEARAVGWNCNSQGEFGPAAPLENDPLLRCAARLHSLDMAERGFFDHTNPDGDGPGQRLEALNFQGAGWGENIAMGQTSPRQVVDGWLESDGHCSNIMTPELTLLGVGYFEGDPIEPRVPGTFWTQAFGAPPFAFGR